MCKLELITFALEFLLIFLGRFSLCLLFGFCVLIVLFQAIHRYGMSLCGKCEVVVIRNGKKKLEVMVCLCKCALHSFVQNTRFWSLTTINTIGKDS